MVLRARVPRFASWLCLLGASSVWRTTACEDSSCFGTSPVDESEEDDDMKLLQVMVTPKEAKGKHPAPLEESTLLAWLSHVDGDSVDTGDPSSMVDPRAVWFSVGLLVVLFQARRQQGKSPPEQEVEELMCKGTSASKSKSKPVVDSTLDRVCPEEGGGDEETNPRHLAQVPLPSQRLRNIGASFVVPHDRIMRSTTGVFNFDIPMVPCVWPLHAILSRSSPDGPWERIELTVDIIKAAGLPPLLSCSHPSLQPNDHCEGTGGTGSSCPAEGVARTSSNGSSAMKDGSCGSSAENGGCLRLDICSGGGALAACLIIGRDGRGSVQRPDGSSWELDANVGDEKPTIVILKAGRQICQATSLETGNEGYLQVDTQPDTQSPESAVLLMCSLVTLAFCSR